MLKDFTENQTVAPLVQKALQIKSSGKRFSDMQDAEGNQYVDLVQEGGGVLGIALVGYTYILEHAGIRFMSLAGTSAGAINTMMVAGLARIGEPVSEKILNLLSNKNLFDLVDGDKAVKKLIQKAIDKEKGIGWTLAFNAIKIYNILKKKLGINPGSNFEDWITAELKKAGVATLKDLNELRKQLPIGLKNVLDKSKSDVTAKVAIITSEITTHTKAEFPRMAELYWKDVLSIPPAKFVRASMSIPFFFEPFELIGLPDAGVAGHPKWDQYAKYSGPVPDSVKVCRWWFAVELPDRCISSQR